MSKRNKVHNIYTDNQKTSRLPIIIALSVLALLIIGTVVVVVATTLYKKPSEEDYSVPSDYYVEYPDVEKYFEENSTVLEIVSVSNSKEVYTEKDVSELLESRGFTEYEITTTYSIEGKYFRDKEISNASSDKHPLYETYYVTENNMIWLISVINGCIMATPSSYNLANYDNVPVLVSESEDVVSYDSSTNSFYINIPNKDILDVRVVDKIDAKTLEAFSAEELANG